MALVESLSGVRGIYGKDLTDEVAVNYSLAYTNFLTHNLKKSPKIVIGMDTRPSSFSLKDSIIRALNCGIYDLGIASTPMAELAVREFNADGGIIITASHNPPEYNGLKFLQSNGGILTEHQMGSVTGLFRNNLLGLTEGQKTIENKEKELKKSYSDFVLSIIGNETIEKIKKRKIRILVDSNGGTGFFSTELLKNIGMDIKGINMDIGKFKRDIEPNGQSLSYLKKIMPDSNAELAVGFDCDADRAEILLRDGTIVSGNEMLALASFYFLSKIKNIKNKAIVVNDATSNVVRETVEKFSGKIIETGVGEANVVEEIYRNNALLGGEGSSSGVIIPPSRCRDGTLSLLAVLSLMADEDKTLEELISILPKYFTINKKIVMRNSNFFAKVKNNIESHYLKKGYKITSKSDSVKILISEKSFLWMRQSKTESGILRIVADSNEKEISERLINEAEWLLKNV